MAFSVMAASVMTPAPHATRQFNIIKIIFGNELCRYPRRQTSIHSCFVGLLVFFNKVPVIFSRFIRLCAFESSPTRGHRCHSKSAPCSHSQNISNTREHTFPFSKQSSFLKTLNLSFQKKKNNHNYKRKKKHQSEWNEAPPVSPKRVTRPVLWRHKFTWLTISFD